MSDTMNNQPNSNSENLDGATCEQAKPIENRHPMLRPEKHGLYDPANEKDNCGVGFVAHIKGNQDHQIVLDAIVVLNNMNHRGACGCEENTGDGAGILTGLPYEFIAKVAKQDLGADVPEKGKFAAGLVFLPQDDAERAECKKFV